MSHHSVRSNILIFVVAVSAIATGAMAQQPQRPERPPQRAEEVERAREAQEQARQEAIRQAQQRAQEARERERQQAQQRDNASERSIVLPQDYPRVTGEPVRSGVAMSTYTRMLSDLDPAYRMFAIGQLSQFDLRGVEHGEIFARIITHAFETRVTSDTDPGVQVFALYRLSDLDMERAVSIARDALDELPRDSDAWRFTLALLACAEPDEFMPMVHDTLAESDALTPGRRALWGSLMVKPPFDEFASMAESIATTQFGRAAESDQFLFSTHDRGPEQPSIVATMWFMDRAYAHAVFNDENPEAKAEHIGVAFGNIVRVALEHALSDERARAFLFQEYLDISPGDEHSWRFGTTTLLEEIIDRARLLSVYGPDRSGTAALKILDSVDLAFSEVGSDASEQERELLDAMRSALIDRESWMTAYPRARTRYEPLSRSTSGQPGGLLPTDETRARLRELMEGVHESPVSAPWLVVPGCVADADR